MASPHPYLLLGDQLRVNGPDCVNVQATAPGSRTPVPPSLSEMLFPLKTIDPLVKVAVQVPPTEPGTVQD
jgi:hypothetical protein